MPGIIGFLRSNITFNDFVSIDVLGFLQEPGTSVTELKDSVLFSRSERPPMLDLDTLARKNLPAWTSFFEVLRVSDNVAELPSEYFDPYDNTLGNLVRSLGQGGGVEQPSFGRRMVIASFIDDRELGHIRRSEAAFRRALGSEVTGVWHGADVAAYCFVDHRSVDQIARGLEKISEDHVTDYVVVEPLELVLTDETKLSALAHWLQQPRRGGRS